MAKYTLKAIVVNELFTTVECKTLTTDDKHKLSQIYYTVH